MCPNFSHLVSNLTLSQVRYPLVVFHPLPFFPMFLLKLLISRFHPLKTHTLRNAIDDVIGKILSYELSEFADGPLQVLKK